MKKTATLFFQFFLPISNSIMQPSCTTVIMYYTVCAFQKETSATLASKDNPFKTMSSDFFAILTSRFSTGAMCNGNALEKMRWRPAPYIRFPGNPCCGSVSYPELFPGSGFSKNEIAEKLKFYFTFLA